MRIIFTVVFCFIVFNIYAQTTVKINGYCPLFKDGTEVKLVRSVPRRFLSSTTAFSKVVGHRFEFEAQASVGEGYLLYINNRFTRLYLEPGVAQITIADTALNDVTVADNPTGIEAFKFFKTISNNKQSHSYDQARVRYYQYLESGNKSGDMLQRLRKAVDSCGMLFRIKNVELTLRQIKQNPTSLLNTYILYNIIDDIPEDSTRFIVKNLPRYLLTNSFGRELQYRIDSLFVGGKAPDFSIPDTAGNQVTLASYRGKYLLIDFWASWCIPCRADNPNEVRAARLFGDRNFSIVGISLDSEKKKWIKAIKEDELKWMHLSDLKEFRSEASMKYYVFAIPCNYLLDPDGNIIAKNLHGKELIQTLNKIFSVR